MSDERKGEWFTTYSGKRFYPLDPHIDDINLEDIAHSLAQQTRWGGHSTKFYSVASHSLMCYEAASQAGLSMDELRWALMHDSAETYLGDVVSPLKRALYVVPNAGICTLRAWEERILQIIAEKFGLPWPIPDSVHLIDRRAVLTESLHNTRSKDAGGFLGPEWVRLEPYDSSLLRYQEPWEAERDFLRYAACLEL